MRNSYIVKILPGMFLVLSGLAACKNKTGKTAHAGHNELAMDSSMASLTKPVNAQVLSTIPAISAESGTRIYASEVNGIVTYDTRNQTSISSRVGGRVERLLIKYNYQPVKKGQLIMEVYSPDLVAAQRELLYVAHSSPDMLSGARQRLQLLGMQLAQIDQVLRTGNVLYRIPVYSNSDGYILEKSAFNSPAATGPVASPAPGGDGMGSMGAGGAEAAATSPTPAAPAATPVLLREGQYVSAGQSLFTIYQAQSLVAEFAFPSRLAAGIKPGQPLLFYPTSDDNAMQAGAIGLIEPVFRGGVNFTLARVYLADDHFQVGQLLYANVPIVYTNGWWLPKKAVWRLGNKSMLFRKQKDVYVPVAVETGVVAKDMIQVTTNIGDWKVASNAAYLVDSESFIKINN